MPRPKADPAIVQSAVARVRAGAPLGEVAESLKVSPSTVHRWVRAAEPLSAPACGLAGYLIGEVVAVLGDSWTIASAAEIAGVPENDVRIWLRARMDRTLARQGLPPDAVPTLLQFSEVRA